MRRASKSHGKSAAIELKWETIDVIELPHLDTADDAASIAKLAEIAENLHRREITALERSELQAAWVEIVQARKRDAQSGEVRPIEEKQRADGKGHRKPSGINQAARELGVPATNLKQSVRIAKLSPEAKAEAEAEARKLKLDDNQDALLEATKAKTPEAQVAAIERRAAPSNPTKPKAKPLALQDLKAAWNDNIEPLVRAANGDVRKAFIEWINGERK